jgi:hypothetical protein
MTQQASTFALSGGLDLITPAIRMPSGHAIAANNYEPEAEGYARIGGYERLDGRPKPSLASYSVLSFDAGQTAISQYDTITGATSGATGIALYDVTPATGTWVGGDATGTIVLVNVSGTFQDNENLQVSAATVAVANGVATSRGAGNDTDDTTYLRAAIEYRRTQIGQPSGSGAIRGVWVYNGDYYCFRDNSGGTAGQMFKSSASGWGLVDLGRTIDFTSGGTYEIAEGDTITGATSGATATVRRVIITSGTFAGGDAAGRLILASQTGTLQAENLNVGANTNVATIAGDSSAITLPAGGTYRFENHNFYGASDRFRMYGVNGVGTAFEFDGTTFVPIITGMTTDTPSHIAVHRNYLFLAFPGGSLQHCGVGDPYSWTPVLGASEIGIGDDVTNLLPSTDTAMAVFARNKAAVLFGDGPSSWVLKVLTDDAGAIADTAQRIGSPIYMDDRGLRAMETTDAFGDFNMGSITQMIEPLFRFKQANGITPVASMRVRVKDQYKVLFSDGTGITVYFGRQRPEALPIALGITPSCAVSAENSDGSEILLIGASNGYVYEMNAGTSFDGSEVEAYLRLAFNHLGSPTYRKRFHKATIECALEGTITVGIIAEFGYADPNQPSSLLVENTLTGGGGFWGEDNWGEFYWGAPLSGVIEAYIDGLGRNAAITIVSTATYEEPHILQALTLNFSNRGLVR